MQYWKEGKVEFVGDPERGNQTWTRKQSETTAEECKMISLKWQSSHNVNSNV